MSARQYMVPKPFDVIEDIPWLGLYWADSPQMTAAYSDDANLTTWYDESGNNNDGTVTGSTDYKWRDSNFGPNSRASAWKNKLGKGCGLTSTNLWTIPIANSYFTGVVLHEYEGTDTGSFDNHYPWAIDKGDAYAGLRFSHRDSTASSYPDDTSLIGFPRSESSSSSTSTNTDTGCPDAAWWRIRMDWTDGAGELKYYNHITGTSGESANTWTNTWADPADTWTPDGFSIGSQFSSLTTSSWHGKIAFVGWYEGDISADPKWEQFKAWSSDFYGITLY